jgi:glycosyl transferase family 25
MEIYYINVSTSTERRAFMDEQFAELGLSATRIDAATTADLLPDDIKRYGNPRNYYWLTDVEQACNLSHLRAMQKFVGTGAPYAAIFEDDVHLSPGLPKFLAEFAKHQLLFDLIKIETFDEPLRIDPANGHKIGDVWLRRVWSWSAGAAGYIISARGARIILSTEFFRKMITDEAMFNPYRPLGRLLTLRYAEPALCIQDRRLPIQRPELASKLQAFRAVRGEMERPFHWYRLSVKVRLFFDRDLRMGLTKAWHEFVGGARKRRIPFKVR